MFRSTRKSVRSSIASFALAVALVGGIAAGTTALTSEAAQAQRNRDRDEASSNSEVRNSAGFAAVYSPLAEMVNATPPQHAQAQAQIPALIAAIENEADRQLAGNLILNIGNGTSSSALQRQGLEMMLASGRVPEAQVGQFHWFVGSIAFQDEDYEAARREFATVQSLGYQPEGTDLTVLTAETYLRADNYDAGVRYYLDAIAAAEAAGNTVPQDWLVNPLQATYDNEMGAEALVLAEKLVQSYPSERNWQNALRIVNQLFEVSDEAQVDLFRLMRLNNAIIDRQEYVSYIEGLDPRVMSNEVQAVLAQGLENGIFQATGDVYYTEVKGIVDQRAPQDRAGIERTVTEGRNGDGLDALSAGDVLYSLNEFARAEEMYRLALTKGYDADTANTRIGITQAEQGNYAGAIETFGLVGGERTPIARMWIAYSRQQMGS